MKHMSCSDPNYRFSQSRLPTRRAPVSSCLVALDFGGIQRSACRTELKDRISPELEGFRGLGFRVSSELEGFP